jgi:limonene 1,2-monooxygenase
MEVENNPNALTLSDMADAIEQGARNIGRDPQEAHQDFTISREVYVADSKEQALEDISEGVKDYYDYLFGLGDGGLIDLATTRTSQTREDLTVEWMAENFPFIYGSPEDCIRQIKYR